MRGGFICGLLHIQLTISSAGVKIGVQGRLATRPYKANSSLTLPQGSGSLSVYVGPGFEAGTTPAPGGAGVLRVKT